MLVYEKMPDGTFQLNGVEFLVPISAWKSTEPPRIMGQALTKAPIGFWFLHVWTWSRVRAVFLPPGIPTSSAWGLRRCIISSVPQRRTFRVPKKR